MDTLRFDHAAICVADAAHARHLFGGVLGFPLVSAHAGDNWDGAPWLMMIYGLPGGGQIALCVLAGKRLPAKPATDLPHYAFCAPDTGALSQWKKKLQLAGFAVRDEDHGAQHSIYFEDRADTTWEITAPPSLNDKDPRASSVVDEWIARHGAS